MAFADLTYEQIERELNRRARPEDATNVLFFDGDHWQNAAGYVGPRPNPTLRPAGYDTMMSNIQGTFVSQNTIREIVQRHVNGLLYRGITWSIIPTRIVTDDEEPTAEEKTLIDEAKNLLALWARAVPWRKTVQDALETLCLTEYGSFRVYVPWGLLSETPSDEEDDEMLVSMIKLEAPAKTTAGVIVDPETEREAGVFFFEKRTLDQPDNTVDTVEICFQQDSETVIVKHITKDGNSSEQWALPLHGRLFVHQMQRPELVTSSIRSLQKSLNLALTMMQHNTVAGGHRERTLINARLPGTTVEQDGQRTFVPEPLFVGAGTLNNFVGIQYTDAEGQVKITQPDYHVEDPVPVETFISAGEYAYTSILREGHQLHYAIAGDALPSMASRISSMADYLMDLMQTKFEVDKAFGRVLETVLNIAAYLKGESGKYADLRVTCTAHAYAGPITSDMLRALTEAVDKHSLSMRTALAMMGVEDVDAEIDSIGTDVERRVAMQQQLAPPPVGPGGQQGPQGNNTPNQPNNQRRQPAQAPNGRPAAG